MAETKIITSQYVRIDQTPAGIGERIFARILDCLVMILYVIGLFYLIDYLNLDDFNGTFALVCFVAMFLPVIFYSFLWEILNRGRSPGKTVFGMRVVMRDGTTPTIGAYFMRWLLLVADTWGWIGIIVILLNKNNQRLGDLAAGTIVIKEKDYHRIHVSLDEFNYLSRNYHPVFPQAENLSLEQVNTINETLMRRDVNRPQRIAMLSTKVKEFLKIMPSVDDETFLRTLTRDYQYYALEEI
ncbi:MAG: RDD family protein [Tannerella sp.]|jgi:uncharacterized RDD family membrane protein YckC|nr:RDD family protein [Tannerella sp.]